MEVQEFTKTYLAEIRRNERPHTVKTIFHTWKLFIAWAKPLRHSGITPETVANFQRHLLEEGYAK